MSKFFQAITITTLFLAASCAPATPAPQGPDTTMVAVKATLAAEATANIAVARVLATAEPLWETAPPAPTVFVIVSPGAELSLRDGIYLKNDTPNDLVVTEYLDAVTALYGACPARIFITDQEAILSMNNGDYLINGTDGSLANAGLIAACYLAHFGFRSPTDQLAASGLGTLHVSVLRRLTYAEYLEMMQGQNNPYVVEELIYKTTLAFIHSQGLDNLPLLLP